ncbi:MAG TPA: CaiB/BaiF CoA-transferase family protein [Hyphomicrobiaceae bacterium]|nr:CaiB/BaiF CoA-transferase family protein [Hyphomicrobiaceae bacterium]
MQKPLEGILVVSLEQAVAAPMTGRRLADAGARVIKLERPEGDFARGYDQLAKGQSVYFIWLNRGKESVVVDLTKPGDRKLFDALLAKADVFVQNLKPGALAKLGYPVEEICARHPRLIACSISGYGDTGPYADRKAYDLLIQAESGLASVTGSAAEPARVGVSIVDVSTGLHAYEAILEALLRRATTGKGADIRVSMFDTIAELMSVPLLQGIYGAPPRRIGLSHISLAPYGVFTTRDNVPILISIQNDREWRTLCTKVFERPDCGTDPRFATSPARIENRPETDGLVAAWFAAHDAETAIAKLDAADIAFGRVNDVFGLHAHPHLRMMGVKTEVGTIDMPVPPAQWMGEALLTADNVPALGQHTGAVREEFLG